MVGYSSPIVALRKELDLYANIRPVVSVRISVQPTDFLIKLSEGRSGNRRKAFRRPYRSPRKHGMSGEFLSGLFSFLISHCGFSYIKYVKQERQTDGEHGKEARATRLITERASQRIGEMAFELANARPRKVKY